MKSVWCNNVLFADCSVLTRKTSLVNLAIFLLEQQLTLVLPTLLSSISIYAVIRVSK